MTELVDALRRELAKLEAELQADPRYVKMARIRGLLAEYGEEMPEREPAVSASGLNGSGKTKAALMEEAITALLRPNKLVHRSKILEHLRSRGIMGHEKNPMNDLAAFLSGHRDLFVSDGRGNFRLQEPQ
jgi:hypothetical protein